MNSADVLAYTYDGAVYCDECSPESERLAPVSHDEVGAIFADDESDVIGSTCDTCRACYVAGWGWTPHEDAVGPKVAWLVCGSCNHHHPTIDPMDAPERCANCLAPQARRSWERWGKSEPSAIAQGQVRP